MGFCLHDCCLALYWCSDQVFEEEDNSSLPLFASVASVAEFSEMRRSLVRKDSGKF